MLRQFSKESLISISSESSKIHLLIKALYRHIWLSLCRQYFLFYALNVRCSPWVFSGSIYNLSTQVFRHEIFQLCQCKYIFVRCHSHIESSHSDIKFQTHPLSTFHFNMPNLWKIDVYNIRYKIRVGIFSFFGTSVSINKCIN